MAQWTNIDPNTLLPGDPWTSAKAQASFENPEAIAEGAPGAPRNLITSLERLSPGTQVRKLDNRTLSLTSSIDRRYDTGFIQYGSISANFEYRRTGTGDSPDVFLRRLRGNSVATILSLTASNTSFLTTADQTFDVIPGDTIYLERGLGATVQIRNFQLLTGGETWWPGTPYTYAVNIPSET